MDVLQHAIDKHIDIDYNFNTNRRLKVMTCGLPERTYRYSGKERWNYRK